MFKNSYGSNSTVDTELAAQQQSLAIEAAKHNDLHVLHVLLGIDHDAYQREINNAKEKNLGRLVKANIAGDYNNHIVEFYFRIIKILEEFDRKDPFVAQELNDALDAALPEAKKFFIKRFTQNMAENQSGILKGHLIDVEVKLTDDDNYELDNAAQEVLQYYVDKTLMPFLSGMEALITSYKDLKKEELIESLNRLERDLAGYEIIHDNSLEEIQKIKQPINNATSEYDVALALHRERVWRALPAILKLTDASTNPIPAGLEGKTAAEIREIPTEELPDNANTIIAKIQKKIDELGLTTVRVPVETTDAKGFTLLLLVALAEKVSTSEGREYDKIIRRLQCIELLFREYKANPFVHFPGSPTKTLFWYFTEEVKICNRSFLKILYDYAEKNYPEHEILSGGLEAASPAPEEISRVREIKEHITAYKKDKIEQPSAFRGFIESKFPILRTAVGRREEVETYLAALAYVEKYIDMELLIVVIDEFSKPRKIERGITGSSALHDPVKKISSAHEKAPPLDKRELLYTTGLVSLVEKIQEDKKIIQQLSSENVGLKAKNMLLEAENKRLKGTSERSDSSNTAAPSTNSWGSQGGSNSSSSSSSSSSSAKHDVKTGSPTLGGGGYE